MWCYAILWACAVAGVALMYADQTMIGVWLGGGLTVAVVIDLVARAPRLRGLAFDQLERQAATMRLADVDEEIAFITRYYGGRALPSVKRRVERIRALPER